MPNLCDCGLIRGSSGKCPDMCCKENISTPAVKIDPIVVYESKDGVKWFPVYPCDVPDAIKDPAVMGRMMKGEMAMAPDSDIWYRAEKHAE